MVIAIGLLLLLVNSYWVFMASEVWHSTQLTIASLFFNAVFTLFVLVLINLALQRFLKRFALSQADLLMIYVMVVMLTTISGHTMMGYLLPAVEHPFWFATAENEWEELFGHYLPTWLVVHDRDVLKGYFEGDSSLYVAKHSFCCFYNHSESFCKSNKTFESLALAGVVVVSVYNRAVDSADAGQHAPAQAVDGERKAQLPHSPTASSYDHRPGDVPQE
jgi:uncharacterized membrane protein YwzB